MSNTLQRTLWNDTRSRYVSPGANKQIKVQCNENIMCVRPIWWNSGGVLVLCDGRGTCLEATLQASEPWVKPLLISSSSEVCLGGKFYLHTRKFSVLRFCNIYNRDTSWTKIVNTLPLTFLILKWTHIPAYPRLGGRYVWNVGTRVRNAV